MRGVSRESALRYGPKGEYVIYRDTTMWVAEPFTPDDLVFELGSSSLDRITAALDEINAALRTVDSMLSGPVPLPYWLQAYYDAGISARIILDPVKEATLEAREPALAIAGARNGESHEAPTYAESQNNFIADTAAENIINDNERKESPSVAGVVGTVAVIAVPAATLNYVYLPAALKIGMIGYAFGVPAAVAGAGIGIAPFVGAWGAFKLWKRLSRSKK